MADCFTNNDFKYLFKRIRQLEDYNFVLNQKLVVYEHVLRFILSLNSWTQCLLAYLLNDNSKKNEYQYTNDILTIPNKMIHMMKLNNDSYQKKLDLEIETRNIKLEFQDTNEIDFLTLNEKMTFLNTIISKTKFQVSNQFSNDFLNDLDTLFDKHGIELDKNKFLHSVDATRLVFSLLYDVFRHMPISIEDFNPTNVTNSVENIKLWIKSNYSKYSSNIMGQTFFINPSIYSMPFRASLISSSEFVIKFEHVMRKLITIKRNEISIYTKSVDLSCFDKFFDFYKERIKLMKLKDVGNGKLKFDNELLNELLVITNTILALPNNQTEFDSLRQNYLVENWLLKKFLNVLLVNTNCDVTLDSNEIFNPIRLLNKSI